MISKPAFHTNHAVRASCLALVLAGAINPDLALAQIEFAQQPPLASSGAGVAPNIILSVDDSGSMSESRDITARGKLKIRMDALKDALTRTFSNPAYLGKFRLAFEAMWNNRGFGPNRFFIPANANSRSADYKRPIDNSMQWFDAVHRQNFLDWVQTLTGTGNLSNGFYSTPSQLMMIYAGEYLKGRWLDSSNTFATSNFSRLGFAALPADANPWNTSWASVSTAADASQLSCRRSYFIFMTDGLWNLDETGDEAFANGGYIYMPFVSDVSGGSVTRDANYDGNPHVLPDGTEYDPAQPYGALYADGYPAVVSETAQSGYSTPLVIAQNHIYPRKTVGQTLYFPLCDGNLAIPALQGYSTASTVNPLSCSSTLADFAFYYWAQDLQPGMDNKLTPAMSVTENQTFRADGRSASYSPYWNPQNDPATWQHMQTYTIGYGTSYGVNASTGALLVADRANNSAYTPGASVGGGAGDVPGFDGYDASGNVMDYGQFFARYASGAAAWPASSADDAGNAYDLIHAAYNGRGKYYPAITEEALMAAFDDILRTAIAGNSPDSVAAASTSTEHLTHGAVTYATAYAYDASRAAYDASGQRWGSTADGEIIGTINGWSGTLLATDYAHARDAALWRASIPSADARRIFTASSTGAGVPFAWASLGGDPSGIAQADIDAVRGSPLGDIVGSQPVFVGPPARLSLDPTYATFVNTVRAASGGSRTGVVYVGANDGLLHGFDAGQGTANAPGTGAELVAYVPRGLLGSVNALGSPHYTHRYWVNGSPFSGDAQIAAPNAANAGNPGNWATVLVGTLGAGGPGYFVLDVTYPTAFAETAANARNLALIDATDATDASSPAAQAHARYIGHQFSPPVMAMYTTRESAQITRINTTSADGEWAVIMGNGYDSASGLPALLVQSLSRARHYPLYVVPATCVTSAPESASASAASACLRAGNGLGAPRPIDVDGNGTADIVYAGDLMGNLWKFDIASPDPDRWSVAYGGQPLFRAVGPTGAAQPITSAPAVAPHPRGGFMVAFGTGQNLSVADTADTRLNSVYALYDNQAMTSAMTTLPESKTSANLITLVSAPRPSPFCPATGSGDARYSACLYAQTGGALDAASAQGVKGISVGASSTLASAQIDGQQMRGWYFDIPDLANGNAGKVLANPTLMSGNTLMILSQNVTSASPAVTGGDSGSDSGAAASAAPGIPTETCDPAPLNPARLTVSFFNLFTGNASQDAISLDAGGVSLSYAPGQGNRFQVDGVAAYVPNGADSLSAVGKDIAITHAPPDPTGRRVGWHIGR